jgi:hypothetical protein
MRIWGRYPLRNAGQLTVLTPMLDFGLGRRGRFERTRSPAAHRVAKSAALEAGKPHDDGAPCRPIDLNLPTLACLVPGDSFGTYVD